MIMDVDQSLQPGSVRRRSCFVRYLLGPLFFPYYPVQLPMGFNYGLHKALFQGISQLLKETG